MPKKESLERRALMRVHEIAKRWCDQPTSNSMSGELIKAAAMIAAIELIARESLNVEAR